MKKKGSWGLDEVYMGFGFGFRGFLRSGNEVGKLVVIVGEISYKICRSYFFF